MNYLMKEIKNRGNFTVLSAIILTIVTFNYKEIALYLIIKPCLASLKYNHMYFIYTNLTEILSNYVTISIVICLVNFCILITYNFIEFIIPGLYKKEIFILKKVLNFKNHSVSDWTVTVLMIFSEKYAYSDQCFIRNTVAHGIN